MLDKLKTIFGQAVEQPDVDDDAALHLAAAVLLVQVAKSDHRLEALELERVRQVLRDEWSLDEADLTDLMAVADTTTEEHVSLHQHVDMINRNFTAAKKLALIRGLWDVACADGQIHHYEELLVRRLADLIYVPHADFIRTKHDALAAR